MTWRHDEMDLGAIHPHDLRDADEERAADRVAARRLSAWLVERSMARLGARVASPADVQPPTAGAAAEEEKA
jgi:hypothetical protein